MKSATLPALRVSPQLRASAEQALRPDETLSQLMQASLEQFIAQRAAEDAFIARGLRFFALAWALRRYGDPIRHFIENRLGLIAALVAGILIALYIIVKFTGIAGSVTSC